MSFQTPITIAEAIRNIENNRYLLPSIQREFEWSHSKIEWLFDSIMRNYPISSFLFWRVEDITKTSLNFTNLSESFANDIKPTTRNLALPATATLPQYLMANSD